MTTHLEVDFQAKVGSFELDVAFGVEGGTTAILGASGAGKTMTLRAIAGLVRPSTGRIRLGDRLLFDATTAVDVPPRRRHVGYVFQEYALFPHLTVAENVAFGLRGVPRAEAAATVRRLLGMLGLDGLEARRPRQLSGGQRQRVALGRALAPRPDLLLLDEPFSSLDSPTRAALVGEFAQLQGRLATPALLVTHDFREAFALASQVVVLADGRVAQSGPAAAVYERPRTAAVAELAGMRNVFTARAGDVDAHGQWFETGGVQLLARVQEPYPISFMVKVGFREEDVEAVGALEGTNVLKIEAAGPPTPGQASNGGLRVGGGLTVQASVGRSAWAHGGRETAVDAVRIPPEAIHVWKE